MTDKQDPIAHAARLLREAAEELRQAHAYNNIEGWENETDAKAAYDEHLAAAQALEDWEAAVGAGGVEPLCKQVAPQTQAAPQPAPHLPERDASLPAERQGLFRKFVVGRVDGSDKPGGKHHGCTYFVLDVDHDPCARPALAAYAAACEPTHPTLAADLRTKWGVVPAPQPAPESIRSILIRCREFIDTTKVPAYPAGADLADEIDVLLAAQPAPAPLSDDVVKDAAFEAVRKKLCALPRFSFLSDGYGVRRVPDKSGSWIAFDAAHALFDPVAVDAALAAQGSKDAE